MRILSLITNSFAPLTIFQLLVSLFFIYEFFTSRDSSLSLSSWYTKANEYTKSNEQYKEVELIELSQLTLDNVCLKDETNPYDKVILVVIDALGKEFIPSLKDHNTQESDFSMNFTESLLGKDKAFGYVAEALSPTVTMPRIKSIVSGTIPTYSDIVFNLARDVSKFDDENLLEIAKSNNKSIVFYGDDTWLSLFDKNIFTRYKETYSFYANDYTYVDSNVTEFIESETQPTTDDWDLLILHYLGLDHIGHNFGSNSHHLIKDKLVEMDKVIETIHNNMSKRNQSSLIIVCGDHGMATNGNHGGDSSLEIETAFMMIPLGKKIRALGTKNRKVKQVDIAPTLSVLMGLPIPSSSLGVVIQTAIENLWSSDENILACVALRNIQTLLKSSIGLEEKHRNKLKFLMNVHNQTEIQSGLYKEYLTVAHLIQSISLKTTAASYQPITLCILIVLSLTLTLFRARASAHNILFGTLPRMMRFELLVALLIPTLLLSSTTFIEFEHDFWPWYALILTLLITLTAIDKQAVHKLNIPRLIVFLITFISTITWNNWTPVRNHLHQSNFLSILALIIICNSTRQRFKGSQFGNLLIVLIGLTTFYDKVVHADNQEDQQFLCWLHRFQILLVLAHIINGFIEKNNGIDRENRIRKVASTWMLISMLLCRNSNLMFIALNIVSETNLNSFLDSAKVHILARFVIYYTCAQAAFYAQGNSNLLSTIDIKPAFFGQTNFNLFLSTLFVLIGTFSSQIYWITKMFQRLDVIKIEQNLVLVNKFFVTLAMLISDLQHSSLCYYMFVCIVLQNHLFIWSVISPKLLYHYVWSLVVTFSSCVITAAHWFAERTTKKYESLMSEIT